MGNGFLAMLGGGGRRAGWYAGFAVYAAGVALFSGPGLDHWWGAWAAGGYTVAAVIAVVASGRAWGARVAVAASLAGALAAPTLWLMTREPTPPDVAVVARSGVLLLQHGTPYLPRDALGHAAFWLSCPVMAFPLTMGITDPPVIALTCLALALLARGCRTSGGRAWSRLAWPQWPRW